MALFASLGAKSDRTAVCLEELQGAVLSFACSALEDVAAPGLLADADLEGIRDCALGSVAEGLQHLTS